MIDRWGFDIEALALAKRFQFRMAIIAAQWIDDADTHVSLWNYFGTLVETLKIRWNLISGAYDHGAPGANARERARFSDR